jgi:hypothetical protein
MTNFEKYKDDLMKTKGDFGFSKTKQKIGVCAWVNNNIETVKCEDCLFDEPSTCCCDSEKVKWLCKEADESVLTNDDFEFIKVLEKIKKTKYKFIAKSLSGHVTLFVSKPFIYPQSTRTGNYYHYTNRKNCVVFFEDTKDLFQGIKGKDGLYDIENKCFIKE